MGREYQDGLVLQILETCLLCLSQDDEGGKKQKTPHPSGAHATALHFAEMIY
jgi:hypothetical protein